MNVAPKQGYDVVAGSRILATRIRNRHEWARWRLAALSERVPATAALVAQVRRELFSDSS